MIGIIARFLLHTGGFFGALGLDFLEGFDVAGRRWVSLGFLDGLAVAAEEDGVHDGEGAADAPHESEDEAEKRCWTETAHAGALPC